MIEKELLSLLSSVIPPTAPAATADVTPPATSTGRTTRRAAAVITYVDAAVAGNAAISPSPLFTFKLKVGVHKASRQRSHRPPKVARRE